jgi:uncharacterized SAM-binding protein YcdF (DUF218 family)
MSLILSDILKGLFYFLVALLISVSIILFLRIRYLSDYLIHIKKPSQVDSIYVFCGNLEEYLWRIETGAEAFKEFKAKEILLSDDRTIGPWVPEFQRNLTTVERAQRRLIDLGVPKKNIYIVPGKFAGTIGESRTLQNFFSTHSTNSLLIVTSPYHLRRAYWCVRKSLNSTIKVYTYTFDVQKHKETLSFNYFVMEYIKLFFYYIVYV